MRDLFAIATFLVYNGLVSLPDVFICSTRSHSRSQQHCTMLQYRDYDNIKRTKRQRILFKKRKKGVIQKDSLVPFSWLRNKKKINLMPNTTLFRFGCQSFVFRIEHLTSSKLLNPHQSAYCKHHSTENCSAVHSRSSHHCNRITKSIAPLPSWSHFLLPQHVVRVFGLSPPATWLFHESDEWRMALEPSASPVQSAGMVYQTISSHLTSHSTVLNVNIRHFCSVNTRP